MAGNPEVLALLEEMLDSGKTPEEVCRDCPELLPDVRQRWQEFRLIETHVGALFPGIRGGPGADAIVPGLPSDGLPRVPGYEVEALLGRGGMGVVYKARHLALKRTVALKMLVASHPHPADRARFRAEAEAVARLQHPNIVQIHEVGEVEGRPFLALEYVAGGSLAERLAGQPLPPRDTARLVATLAEAMHLAHSRNLVHRDLKPANVLLAPHPKSGIRNPKQIQRAKQENPTPNDRTVSNSGSSDFGFVSDLEFRISDFIPKVTDFGLVRQLDADSGQTVDGMVIGTPSYMAPEQAEGRARSAGPAADVYALGAILYECLTGRPPFEGATPLETLEQVRSQAPAAPSSMNRQAPRDLETICLKCLRKEPERRYSSAQELADDLGRFLRGEPVAARPAGRLERVAKWTRRNPTIASLSATAALALVAGTVVSLLFGAEAHRKANELEQQTIQLQEQTHAAQKNARRAEENEREVGRVLLSGLLLPIGRNPHRLAAPLDAAEADAVRQLRAAPASLRLQFLETALRDSETARRVGRRADWVVQAIVGCDRDLRADVARLVVRRIQEPEAPPEVQLACARLGLAVNLSDRVWAERSVAAVMVALHDPLVERADYPQLAEALAALSERLPPAQAADQAALATDVFLTLLQDPVVLTLAHESLGQAIVTVSPQLDAAAASRAAAALAGLIRQPDSPVIRWPSVATALAAVCRRLPPADSAARVNETVDFILATRSTTKADKRYSWTFHTQVLAALSRRLDAAGTARVAEALVAFLGDSETFGGVKRSLISSGVIPQALSEMAEDLDAEGGLRAAEGLVLVLRKAEPIETGTVQLRTALAAVCRRLDATGAARVSEAIVAAVRDPEISGGVRPLLAAALAVVAGKLDPAGAASLEEAFVDALVADLADAKSRYAMRRIFQVEALGTVCGRPGAKCAARAAETLTAAFRDPQTGLGLSRPLAEALAAVGGQLTPTEAHSHANQAVAVLGSQWVAKTGALDRASLAPALAALWTRLEPTEAAAHARRAAADLEHAMRDAKTAPLELPSLADALAAVYAHLDPAERVERANALVDTLVAARRRHRNDPLTAFRLSEPLAALCARLDRPGAVRVADALLVGLDDPNLQQFQLMLYDRMFKKVADRLDERDLRRLLEHPLAAGRLQRVLLDVLAGSKSRTFRNTWDYLDGIASDGNGTDGLSPGTNR
jgi:serine/threonine protein kinase